MLLWDNTIEMFFFIFYVVEVTHIHINNHFLCNECGETCGCDDIDVQCDLVEL